MPSSTATRDTRYPVKALLPGQVYPFRIIGMLLGTLPPAVVLHARGLTPGLLALLVFTGILWPQVAWLLAHRSRQPYEAERRNLMIDSCIAGLWAPLMLFNLLPSVLLVTVTTADKIHSGIRGLWQRSLIAVALGILVGGGVTGFRVELATSTPVLLACLPLLIVHTLAVSLGNYRLVRTVQQRNQRLAELSQQDPLTGLANRRHWLAEATRWLTGREPGTPAPTLVMIDVDAFKTINDRYGHAMGDEVLGVLAALLRKHGGPAALPGRLGGDEFALLLPGPPEAARAVAERLRAAMEAHHWNGCPDLVCTLSLGLAVAHSPHTTVPSWREAADRALYRAKQAGRNRLAFDPALGQQVA